MSHPAMLETAHRPWPLPRSPWCLTMDWEDLLFLHWPVAADVLQQRLPEGVEVETFDGRAWLGVVPFRMAHTRLRALPPVPTAHTFPEINVRTYVHAGGRSGVWFWSLDATSRLAIAGARAAFGLPYFRARMRCERRDRTVHYASDRRDPRAPGARFRGSWTTPADTFVAAPGTLEHFLVERYCLFARRRGRLVCADITHAPWRLARADVQLDLVDMTALLGCRLEGEPASVLATAPQRVVAWRPKRWLHE